MKAFVKKQMGPALRAKESVSDLLQSSIRELLKQEKAPGKSALGSFLKVAKRKICDRARFWRFQKRDQMREEFPREEIPVQNLKPLSQGLESREETKVLEQALHSLPAPYEEVIRRVRLQGESIESVALSLGRSEKAVSNLLYRALAELARRLDRHELD